MPAHFRTVLAKIKPENCCLFIAKKTFCGVFWWLKNRYFQSGPASSRLNASAWFYSPA
jgi:hypothetical protein